MEAERTYTLSLLFPPSCKMIMKRTSIYLLSLLIICFFSNCRGEEALLPHNIVDEDTNVQPNTELSQWIYEHYTIPYGIAVHYRWNKNTAPKGSYATPPSIEKIKPVLEVIEELFIGLYTNPEFGDSRFFKSRSPIALYLYGGRNTDAYGVELMSNSQAPSIELHVYNVNTFDPANKDKVYLLLRSVHHQYAKRLMELFPYDRDAFLSISRHRYTYSAKFMAPLLGETPAAFYGLNAYANMRGFYSLPAFLSAEDDLAEIISCTLLHTPKEIREAQERAKTPEYDPDPKIQQQYNKEAEEAHRELLAKQQFVYQYFEKVVKLPLRRLQVVSVKKMRNYLSHNS